MNCRWFSRKALLLTVLSLFVTPPAVFAGVFTIDFEGLTDGAFVTTQYPGATFSNAMILTAGISLNELDFPAHSGQNVVSDFSGPLSLSFASPILDFSGHFTYATSLTIQGFDSSNNLTTSVSSLFSNNTLSAGDLSSSPNEFLEISSAMGLSRVVITGDPSGGSFALDDLSFTTGQVSSTPEPSSLALTGLIVLLFAAKASRRR